MNKDTRLRVFGILFVLAAGSLQLYALRFAVADDEASYLDIARRLAVRDWSAALNGYWSPLYPFLISLGLRLAPSVPEFLVIQVINFPIFLAATGAFWWLWIETDAATRPATAVLALCTCVFSLLRTWRQPVGSPDTLVAAFVFAIGASLLHLRRRPRVRGYAVFGALLAAGYFAKSVLFPVAIFALLIVAAPFRRKLMMRCGVSLGVFALIAGPLVFGISERYGHLTFSESGKLNYAWWVAGVPMYVDWVGDPIGGRPLHAPKLLSNAPSVLSYSGEGTYPPWYEPSYWYQGVDAHASVSRHLMQIVRNIKATLFFPQCVLIVLLLLSVRGSIWKAREQWRLLALGIAPILAYCLVTTNERYIAGFATVVVAAMLSRAEPDRVFSYTVSLILVTATLYSDVQLIRSKAGRAQAIAAQSVLTAGVKVGSSIAIIGDPDLIYPGSNRGASYYGASQELWAWIDRFRIVAAIPPEEAPLFDRASKIEQARLLCLMADAGATAVVEVNHPGATLLPGWLMVRSGRLSIYLRR